MEIAIYSRNSSAVQQQQQQQHVAGSKKMSIIRPVCNALASR